MRLQWDLPPSQLNYDPLLITCFEGLLETEHPYKFVSREAARELLQADGAADKVLPLLQRLIQPLRMALMTADREVFSFGLDVLKTLSELLGMHLNQYLHLLLQQLGKKLSDRLLRDKVFEVLTVLEEQGGEEVQPLIKAKIPTYRT